MKRIAAGIIVLALTGGVAYRAYQAYRARDRVSRPAAGRAPAQAGGAASRGAGLRLPLVEVAAVREGQLEEKVFLIGSLRPIAEVQVMSKIAGRIEQVTADVGDRVSRGQLLAQVDEREIQEEIRQAQATLEVARATIHQREAELANTSRQVRRYRELHEQNLISRQELDDWITRQQSAEAQLELSRAQARQSEASLAQHQLNLANTRSYAPMDGLVAKRTIHPGALVTANTPIMTVVDLRVVRLMINPVERVIVRLRLGMPAEVAVDAFPGRLFPGRVQRVSPVLDPATRTGEVEIQVPNPSLELRAEMFARVVLDLGQERRGVVVPREALVYRGDQGGVYVLDGNRARFRAVESGNVQQGSVEIVKGLALGERVVTMGASLLKDGDEVRIKGDDGVGKTAGANPNQKAGAP